MTVAEAAAVGNAEAVRRLLEDGGSPNEPETEEHWPPLMEAASEDHVEVVRLLLDAGADMVGPHSGGETPLLMAVQTGSLRVWRLLLERGCQMDPVRDNASWMLTHSGSQHVEIARWLLAEGVDVDATDFQGCTALTYAAHAGRTEVMQALLRAGADPDHRDDDDETVLMWAADHEGNAGALRVLLRAGADVNARSEVGSDVGSMRFWGTALHWTMRHGDTEMIRVLLDAGADPNSPNVLIRAAYDGFAGAVGLLLERGADVSTADDEGQTALRSARTRGHREVAGLLERAARGGPS